MTIGTGRIGRPCLVAVALCSGGAGGGGVSSALAQPVLQWEHRYPSQYPVSGVTDAPVGVASTATHIYVAGTEYLESGNTVFSLAQYELAEDSQNPGIGKLLQNFDFPVDVERQAMRPLHCVAFVPGDNGYMRCYLIGTAKSLAGNQRVAWAAVDNTGTNGSLRLLWSRVDSNGADGDEIPVAVVADQFHVAVVLRSPSVTAGDWDIVTRVADAEGHDAMNEKRFDGGGDDVPVGLVMGTAGEIGTVMVAGTTTVDFTGQHRMVALAYDIDSDAEWFGSPLSVDPGSGYYLDAVVAASQNEVEAGAWTGDLAVAGTLTNTATGDKDIYTTHFFIDMDLVPPQFVQGALRQVWDRGLSGIDFDEPKAIACAGYISGSEVTGRPHIWVAGTTRNGSGHSDIVVLAYQPRWPATEQPLEWWDIWDDGDAQRDDMPRGITYSEPIGHKRVHVTGATKNSSGNFDITALKYDTAYEDGGRKRNLWFQPSTEPVCAGPAGDDIGLRIWNRYMSGSASFFICGTSYHATYHDDWETLRYSDNP